MQLVLLLKDFPTGVIYECMHEWHKFQIFADFGGCESIKVYNEFQNTFPLHYHGTLSLNGTSPYLIFIFRNTNVNKRWKIILSNALRLNVVKL